MCRSEYYCYPVSEFLDPRVFKTLTENEKTMAINIIRNKLVSESNNEYKDLKVYLWTMIELSGRETKWS